MFNEIIEFKGQIAAETKAGAASAREAAETFILSFLPEA